MTVTAAAGVVLVSAILGELEKRVDAVIARAIALASSEARAIILDVANAARSVIANFSVTYKDLLSRTINEVGTVVRDSLDQVESIVFDIDRLAENSLADAEAIVNKSRALVDSVRGTRPRVYNFSPRAVVASADGGSSSEVVIRIVGANLARAQPRMLIAGTECALRTRVGDELEFIASSDRFRVLADSTDLLVGARSVAMNLEFSRTRNGNQEPQQFLLGVFVFPRTFGTYEVVADVRIEEPQPDVAEARETGELRCTGNDGSNNNCRFNITIDGAVEGWKLDPNSLSFNETFRISGGNFEGYEAITDTSFTLKLFGRKRTPAVIGAVGKINGTVRYLRVRPSPNIVRQETRSIGQGELSWGQDLFVDLPDNTVNFRISTSLFDGSLDILSAQQLTSRYLRLDFDPIGKSIVINPLTVEDLIGLF